MDGMFIDNWTYEVFAKEGDNFETAQFRLWTPENDDKLNGILVLLDHYNGNGLYLAEDLDWRKFATNFKLAIISVYFYSTDSQTGYFIANQGSGQALQDAVVQLGQRHNLSQLSTLPFLLRGYSGGGMFSYTFSAYYPELVAGIADVRGGGLLLEMARNVYVPGLILVGEYETARIEHTRTVINSLRDAGGTWGYAIQPKQNHYGNLKPADDLVRSFFEKVIEQRVDSDTKKLIEISQENGWLGNHQNLEIHSFETYPEIKMEASWLIDEVFAIKWQEFQK